jgi:hypothetical protein
LSSFRHSRLEFRFHTRALIQTPRYKEQTTTAISITPITARIKMHLTFSNIDEAARITEISGLTTRGGTVAHRRRRPHHTLIFDKARRDV